MTTKLNQNALRKIKRCMDLSKSANEHEAAMAFKQMQALMDKYGVNAKHVMAYEVEEYSTKLGVKSRPANWVVSLHRTIGQAMDCESMIQRGSDENAHLIYVGVGSTPEIAGYAFEVMMRKLKADRAAFSKAELQGFRPARKAVLADAYCEGWVRNVYSKVRNLNPNLEVKEKIKAYKETGMDGYSDENVVKIKSRVKNGDDNAMAALNMGYEKSKDVDLFAATGHTAQVLIGEQA